MLLKLICQILNFGRARGLRRSKNKVFSTIVENFDFSFILTSLFVSVLKMALRFKKRDIRFVIVFINEIEFQNENFFGINRKNFVF